MIHYNLVCKFFFCRYSVICTSFDFFDIGSREYGRFEPEEEEQPAVECILALLLQLCFCHYCQKNEKKKHSVYFMVVL